MKCLLGLVLSLACTVASAYQSLTVRASSPDLEVWNTYNQIFVTVQVVPALDQNDVIIISLDGNKIRETRDTDTMLVIGNVYPGVHTVTAYITGTDKEKLHNDPIIKSTPVTVLVQPQRYYYEPFFSEPTYQPYYYPRYHH